VEPLSCVLHGVEKLAIDPGARAAIVGAGPIGLLLARTLLARGVTRIDVAERSQGRRDFAATAADRTVADRTVADAAELDADGYDIVVDATGAPAAMAATLGLARPGAQILWFGVPDAEASIRFEPFAIFRKGLSIHGSFTSVRNSMQAVEMLASGAVRTDDLVTHRVGLEQVEEAFGMLRGGDSAARKVLVLPA
jgi:D-arabinitol dehydrogenase (NADP+)